jgi:aminoglycoside phosphotransferase family enzyme
MKIDQSPHWSDDTAPTWSTVAPTLADKVAFLSSFHAHGNMAEPVTRKETHMSWVFLSGEHAYKMKKPVRLPYLDFSSLDKRHRACIAEWTLNRRLAPDVYVGLAPLVWRDGGLAIGGDGEISDWLVIMRRLDPACSLDRQLADRRLTFGQLRIVLGTLDRFYRRTSRVRISSRALVAHWSAIVAENRVTLSDARGSLPSSTVRRLAYVHRRFLDRHRCLLAERALAGRIVDGHGDLRPEHVWPGPPARIIDCLEFSAGLRAVDPADDLAFLSLECNRLGNRQFGDYIHRHALAAFELPRPLFHFYRSCRAVIRARLAIAHLFEASPATPDKWPRLAKAYLRFATEDAMLLERWMN